MRQLIYVVVTPMALPLLAGLVAYQHLALARGWRQRRMRVATWYWRIWWFYGYRFGLYRLDWWMKSRVAV